MRSSREKTQSEGVPSILIVTGASGAGKTTLVRELEALGLDGVRCYYFDSIGVPSPEEMKRRFGSGAEWQTWATEEWISRLVRNSDGAAVAVLDGQVRPSTARSALEVMGTRRSRVILIDCDHAERNARLRGPRGQPDLAQADMDCWAAYLRGQADALGLPIIDTSVLSVTEAVAALAAHVRELTQPETSPQ